eukprot:2122242-Pyramimonas_sp.AAC.1
MAEHLGIAICGHIATRPAQLGADCMAAIRLAQKDVDAQLALPNKFAGIRAFAQQLEGTAMIPTIRHVKAHREREQI